MKQLLTYIWNGIKKAGRFLWSCTQAVAVVEATYVGVVALVAFAPISLPLAWIFRAKVSMMLEQYTKWIHSYCLSYARYFAIEGGAAC